MAAEPAAPRALLLREPLTTTTTRLRVVIDDLIDLILRPQLTSRTLMPGLPARLAPLAFLASQLLRLLPRFRAALLPGLRRIGGRWPGTCARVLPCLLLQPLQAIPVLPNLSRQTKNELDTRLTPRVINCFRVRTLHACKIRCTLQESLPMAPTTERLR
jgi:hypothetical protein